MLSSLHIRKTKNLASTKKQRKRQNPNCENTLNEWSCKYYIADLWNGKLGTMNDYIRKEKEKGKYIETTWSVLQQMTG